MKRCFVTGANGFVGFKVVRSLLAHGYQVTALAGSDLDARNLDGLAVEVRDLEYLHLGDRIGLDLEATNTEGTRHGSAGARVQGCLKL